MPKSEYFRIKKEVTIELKEKKSIFLGHCRLSRSEKEAKKQLGELTNRYKNATHNCWAYSIGFQGPREYYSDAGEPSGSAGKPILGAISSHGINDVLIVVTRYFGGIKLGVRGLIETYGRTAALALEEAGRILFIPTRSVHVILPYESQRRIFHMLKNMDISENDAQISYGESINVILPVPTKFVQQVEELFSGLLGSRQIFSWEWLKEDAG